MQDTMALVECHADLYTTVQGPNESIGDYFKIFMAQKDTVNAHGREAGRHKQLHQQAHQKIMDKLGFDKAYMENPNNLATKDEVEEEARAKSKEQFLACLFFLMADKVKYKPIKDLLNNEFLMGKRSYPETVIEAKRLLAEFTMPEQPSRKPAAVVDDGS